MSTHDSCHRCGSDRLIRGLKVTDRGHGDRRGTLSIEVDQKPDALFFKETVKFPLKATVCESCGDVELRIERSRQLREALGRRS